MESQAAERKKLEEEAEAEAELPAPTDVDDRNVSVSEGGSNKRQRHSPERSEGGFSPSPTKSPKEGKSGK
jgi:hypothetical protein